MAKFRINDNVVLKENGKIGVVVCKDEINDKATNRTSIKYYVKFGNGEGNYGWFTRQELTRHTTEEKSSCRVKTKVYDMPKGYKLTVVSIVENVYVSSNNFIYSFDKEKRLRIGLSFYNPTDVYDETIGFKIAKHRATTKPFTDMRARFLGEFNEITTEAIMDAKAKYVYENLDNFIK